VVSELKITPQAWRHRVGLLGVRPSVLEPEPPAAFVVAPSKMNPHPKAPDQALVNLWRQYLWGLWLSGLRLEESLILSREADSPFAVDLIGCRPTLKIFAEAHRPGGTLYCR
jgi:hypothetical protein